MKIKVVLFDFELFQFFLKGDLKVGSIFFWEDKNI